MIKIAYIHHTSEIISGSSRALLSILDTTKSSGINMIVVLSEEGELKKEIELHGGQVFVIPFSKSTLPEIHSLSDAVLFPAKLLRRYLKNIKATKGVAQLVHRENVTAIHSNTSVIDIGYRVAKKLGIPHFWHLREYSCVDFNFNYSYYGKKGLIKRVQEANNYPICITEGIKEYYYQTENPRAQVIYDGVFHEPFKSLNKSKKNYFLYVGRLNPQKGIEQLLRAYADYVSKTDVKPLELRIVGDTNDERYKNYINKLCQQLQLKGLVVFCGTLNSVDECMSEARAYINPSCKEGFGFTTVEAMLQKTLVIGNNNSGTKEQFDIGFKLKNKEIGLRYNTQDELTNWLLTATTIPEKEYNEIVTNAQDVVKKMYTIEQNVQSIVYFYKSVCK